MKKCLVIIICIILCVSNSLAEQEITFQDIPWLIDEEVSINLLSERGLLRKDVKNPTMASSNVVFIIEREGGLVLSDQMDEYANVVKSISLQGLIKGKIAGCPVKDVLLTFAYDGDFKLISIKIDLLNCDYSILKSKLSKVYGVGEESSFEEDQHNTIWRGENQTCIILSSYISEYDYSLVYGRLDAEEILKNCLAPADPDDVSGL